MESLKRLKSWCGNLYRDLVIYIANHIVAHVPVHVFRLWFYRAFMNWRIGKQTSVQEGLRVMGSPRPGCVVIGDNCCLGDTMYLCGPGDAHLGAYLHIGNNVNIAFRVMIITAGHNIATDSDFEIQYKPVVIEDHAVIFARATIVRCRIGRGAVVLPGALVVKDVEPFTVVGGAPAKVLGRRPGPETDPHYRLNWHWRFH